MLPPSRTANTFYNFAASRILFGAGIWYNNAMAYKCELCGKKPVSGKSYSHSHRATKRLFKPNLQKQKVELNGKTQSIYVCTGCIKSGKAVRPQK